MTKWKKIDADELDYGHEILDKNDFWISFNPNPGGSIRMFKGETDDGETALCKNESPNTLFYILNGDFRKEYEALADKGFLKCKEFFDSKKEYQSNWSIKAEE